MCFKNLSDTQRKYGASLKLYEKLRLSRAFLKVIGKLLKRRYMQNYEKKHLDKIEHLLKISNYHLNTYYKIISCFLIKAFPNDEIIKGIWSEIFSVPRIEEKNKREEEKKLMDISMKLRHGQGGARSSKRHGTTSLSRQGSVRDEVEKETDKFEDERKEILEYIYNIKENFVPPQSKGISN